MKKRLTKCLSGSSKKISDVVGAIVSRLNSGGKVLLFGNGGSAADAQHIAAEFIGRYKADRPSMSAIALTTDTSALTAIGNDYGFDKIFSRQIEGIAQREDVAVGISTSGTSKNVLLGIEKARDQGLTTIGLTGGDGGRLAELVDIPVVVPSTDTARIQECHITIGHILCGMVEEAMFGDSDHADSSPSEAEMSDSKIVGWEILLELRERWKAEDKIVVWTNGCFDLLHVGHVRSLDAASQLGDVLVVGLNSDESVRRIENPRRPIVQETQRAEVLAALESVDYVVTFEENTPERALSRLRPDVHCKGEDYAPPDGKPIPEAQVVDEYGGRIEFLPLVPSVSTSKLIKRIRESTD